MKHIRVRRPRLLLGAGMVAALVSMATMAGATTIDFETPSLNGADDSYISPLEIQGVRFIGMSYGFLVRESAHFPCDDVSATNQAYWGWTLQYGCIEGCCPAQMIRIEFPGPPAAPVTHLSLEARSQNGPLYLWTYDGDGDLGTTSIQPAPVACGMSIRGTLEISTARPIAYAEIWSGHRPLPGCVDGCCTFGSPIVIDNVTFDDGPSVEMSFDFDPNTLNLQSMGHWVSGTLEPEPPASPSDIDIASIRLNGSVPVDASAPASIGDADSDGRPDLTVKFDRAAVELAVAEGESVPVAVTGNVANGCFSAIDVIRVIRGHVTAPAAGAVLHSGGTAEVRWDTPAGVQVQSVAVLWSSDDGASWSLVANGQPNSGSYLWSLPNSSTSAARVAVVLVESADPSGYEVTGALGVSGRFAITTSLGVIGPGLELALHGPVRNPGTSLTVSFSLPDGEPATLVAYDVSGREVTRSAVGIMGAGRHVVTIGTSRTLPSGVYLVHLIRGDRRLVTRTVVVR